MGDILRQSTGGDVRLFAHMPIIRDIVYGAVARGARLHHICKELKIDVADLDDSEKRAGFETSCRAWELAVKMTGDPLLGLHIGESSSPSIMGLVGYLMQNSETLLHAFKQVSSYGRIATNMFGYRIIEKKNEVMLQYAPVSVWEKLYPNGARQARDQAMAGTLNVFYLLSGVKVYAKSVEISHLRRNDRDEYERVFRVPVRTAKTNQLIFDRERLLAPVLRYDRSLFRVFEELVRKKGHSRTFAGEVRDLILMEFKGQVPPQEVLAARFNMTVRSFQRRLSADNASFRRISRQITKEVGKKLLESGEHKVVDVAKILGYSSPRAFRRAYKAT